jgi:hypothetical protein
MFVDRVGLFVVTGGPKAFEVRKATAPAGLVSHKLTAGIVEKVFLDQETGTCASAFGLHNVMKCG